MFRKLSSNPFELALAGGIIGSSVGLISVKKEINYEKKYMKKYIKFRTFKKPQNESPLIKYVTGGIMGGLLGACSPIWIPTIVPIGLVYGVYSMNKKHND